jgi:hypothetical protein
MKENPYELPLPVANAAGLCAVMVMTLPENENRFQVKSFTGVLRGEC